MTFADITIVPVAQDRKSDYLAFSQRMAEVYCDHGATRVVDYWQATAAADPKDFHAEGTSYEPGDLQGIAEIAGASRSESVVVTVIEWPSYESRDQAPRRPLRTRASPPRSTTPRFSTDDESSERSSRSRWSCATSTSLATWSRHGQVTVCRPSCGTSPDPSQGWLLTLDTDSRKTRPTKPGDGALCGTLRRWLAS